MIKRLFKLKKQQQDLLRKLMQESVTRRTSSQTLRGASHLNPELQRVIMEKQLSQQRLLKQLAFKDESFQLFQNDHNLKLDQFSLQMNEQMLRIKRKYELQIDNLKGNIVSLEGELIDSSSREHQYQSKLSELNITLGEISKQLLKAQTTLSQKQKQILKLSDANRDLQLKLLNSQNHNTDMQQQILVLLQVEKNQSAQIQSLSQNQSQQKLKIQALAGALTEIQAHLQIFSDKIKTKETQCTELKYIVSKMDSDILTKQEAIQKLATELQQSIRREKIREEQVKHLIKENERLYNQLNNTRHRLHDLAIAHNITI